MTEQRARRLAWRLCALALLLVPTGPLLLSLAEPKAVVFALCFGAVQISTAAVGAVVASRLPRNPVGWILLTIGAGLGLSVTAAAYGELGTGTASGPLPGDEIAAWVGEWSFVPAVFGGVMFLLHVFPDGRFMSRRWRRVGIASAVIVLFATISDALAPGPLENVSDVDNPVGATGAFADIVLAAQSIIDPLALPVFALAGVGLVVRLRRSRGVERQQLKWIAFALTFVAVGLGVSAASPQSAGDAVFLLALLALAAMPVATGIAMLRYRLYDIDVVINRALVYGALTATLAALYLGSVLMLQLALSGLIEGSGLPVAASTLAVAALFRPARKRIQRTVDRRFYRQKYDAGRTLQAFGVRLRDEVDLDTLQDEVRTVVARTMQPARVSLWLRRPA